MMPRLPLVAVPSLRDNYIWMLGEPDRGVVLVDPGDAAPILPMLADGLRIAAVLLTHHHPDHTGGAAELCRRSGATCFGPQDPRIELACERVTEGSDLLIDRRYRFSVLAVPGHTRSHVAFVGEDLLFCGDTLFSLGCGRLFEGTPAQMLGSLDRLAALPDHTRVCCGHEYTLDNARFAMVVEPDNPDLPGVIARARARRADGLASLPVTIGDEKRCNPFLRTDAPAVISRVARRLGRAPRDRVECLAELRRWKDGFTG